MSHTAVTGNMSEPELRFTPGGKAVCNFGLAENHWSFNKDKQEWEQTGTTWYRVTLWEDQAEIAAEKLSKGQKVIAVGQTRTRAFTRKDGTEGSVLELQVDSIGPALPKRHPQGDQGGGSPGGQQNAGGFGNASDPWAGQPQQTSPGGWGGSPSGGGWDTPASAPPF